MNALELQQRGLIALIKNRGGVPTTRICNGWQNPASWR